MLIMDILQGLVANLGISRLETRTDQSPDVAKYLHGRDVTHITLSLSPKVKAHQNLLIEVAIFF